MYVYQSTLYCDACGERLLLAGHIKGEEERPQYVLEEPTDSPQHCDNDDRCINAIDLGLDGQPLYGAEKGEVGALLGDELTEEGRHYVLQTVASSGDPTPYQRALHELWVEHFSLDWKDVVLEALRSLRFALGPINTAILRRAITWIEEELS